MEECKLKSEAIKAVCENCEYFKNEELVARINKIPPANIREMEDRNDTHKLAQTRDLPQQDEYVSKRVVIEAILDSLEDKTLYEEEKPDVSYADGYDEGLRNAAVEVLQTPSVNVRENTIGNWVEHHEPFAWMGDTYWTCSECETRSERTNFCPNCGADMRGKNDEKIY